MQATCPVCARLAGISTAPFCSGRCREVDLNRWLGGVYRVKTEEKPQDEPNPEADI